MKTPYNMLSSSKKIHNFKPALSKISTDSTPTKINAAKKKKSSSSTIDSPNKVTPSSNNKPSRKNSLLQHRKRPMSAQRVSLFQFPSVTVNIVYDQQQKLGSSRFISGVDGASESNDTLISDNHSSTSTNCSSSSYGSTLKTTQDHGLTKEIRQALVIEEPIEIYEIKTMDENNISIGCYLSLGKNDKIVNPILPKLKIVNISKDNLRYQIYFFASLPTLKYWELIFPEDMLTSSRLEFIDVLSKICNYQLYSVVKEELETDEIEEFLYSDDDYEVTGDEEFCNDISGSMVTSSKYQENLLYNKRVNQVFQNAMSNITYKKTNNELSNGTLNTFFNKTDINFSSNNNKAKNKRFSSYDMIDRDYLNDNNNNNNTSFVIDPFSNVRSDRKLLNRRSISVPLEFYNDTKLEDLFKKFID
ncbi:Inp1p SCDLUD_001200 [Saccharomycodes ludwigii]|uniref:Inp1p n=1 Tax=Saccharomycodes ludwigii TaxID=36035 RepID=UPI001E8325C9|nr:hypothetical protein SCDLUD_001200 [Saccharomycodes ludwigii]KAH3903558.1 hypothetical protein SCDLUD_001200 [Saccharomycodes ludwigii]